MDIGIKDYKKVLLDPKMRRIPSTEDKEGNVIPKDPSRTDGTVYIQALLPPEPGSAAERNRQKRKFILRREDGSPKPADEFSRYPSGNEKKPHLKVKAIREAVERLHEELGFSPQQQAIDVMVHEQKKVRMISSVFEEFIKDMKDTVVKQTMEPRSENTLYESGVALRYYLQVFGGDHSIDQFPKLVEEQFMLRMKKLPKRPGSKERLSNRTIRKHGIAMNVFFGWMAKHGWIKTVPPKLELPSRGKTDVRVFKPESLGKLTSRIERLLAEAEADRYSNGKKKTVKKGRRQSDADVYRNHLRTWLMMRYCALRVGEVWSLRLENIELVRDKETKRIVSGKIIIRREIDEDGGKDHFKKPFRVKFRSKSRIDESVPIPDILLRFLEEDNKHRDDAVRFQWNGWFLSRSDGSCAYSSPAALGKAIERHLKELGIHGEAKRCHGLRSTCINMIAKEHGIDWAKRVARHKSVLTTEESYVENEWEELVDKMNSVFEKFA